MPDSQSLQRATASIESKERGDALMRNGDLQQAAQCYYQAIAGDPAYASAHLNLGFVLTQQGAYPDAQHHLMRSLELDPDSTDANYLLGRLYLMKGQLEEAEEHFRKTLLQAPEFLPAYGDLCALLAQSGRLGSAVQLINDGVKRNPGDAGLHYYLGNLYFEQRELERAISSYQAALSIDPAHPQACANLGLTLLEKGALDQAAAVLQRAMALEPESADVCNNLGSALHGLDKFEDAIAVFNRGLAIDPRSGRLHRNLGLSLHACERFDQAIAQFRTALSLNPDDTEVHFQLGNSLYAQKKTGEAIASFKTLLSSDARHLEARNNLGNALLEMGEANEALACFEQALDINPNYAAAHYGKGNVLRSQARLDAAVACFEQAVKNDPDFLEAHVVLGDVLCDLGRLDEAEGSYTRVLEIDPDHDDARWVLAMLKIPAIASSNEEVVASRARFSEALADLNEWFSVDRMESVGQHTGDLPPFYLAYQEENNRDLLATHGALRSRLTGHWADKHMPPVMSPDLNTQANTQADGAVRVGIVSAHIFQNHSVWNAIVKGWFDHLNRDHIELHVFYLGTVQDGDTAWAESRSASFEQGKKEFEQWVAIIQQKQLDVLIYPEIGMDRLTAKLASMRIAPVQVATWGHPETSGLPTMDYFLSAEDLEPANAQDNYTEELILLPRLGCHYYPSEVESADPDLAALGIDNAAPLLLCPGTPYKYAPKHDRIFTGIAGRLGRCQFIFFSSHLPALNDKLRARLRAVFAEARMNFEDFCVFIPWQDKPAFYGLMKRADVFLDTIGFSGFNTAIQAMECDLPIVTREGRFMRGRLAGGILRRMGLSELIAATESAYIDLAVKLVQDAAYRHEIRQRITSSRAILFNDVSSVRALEMFLIRIADAQHRVL